MRSARLSLSLVLLGVISIQGALALGGCDSGEDPLDRSNSTFPQEGDNGRALVGRVFADTETVGGAVVRIDPASGLTSDSTLAQVEASGWVGATDPTGIYRFNAGPFRYDLAIRNGAEVFVMKSLGLRFIEPCIAESAPVEAFRARIEAVTEPPPAPGNAIAYFFSGTDGARMAVDVTGGGLDVRVRKYTSTVTLHAIEYVIADGLRTPVSSGQVDVRVTADASSPARVPMVPFSVVPLDVVFSVVAPPGFTVDPVDVMLDRGDRTNTQRLAQVPSGGTLRITPVAARYSVHVSARRADGAVTDSGLQFFDPAQKTITIELPEPAKLASPIDEAVARPTDEPVLPFDGVLASTGEGVHEHVLVPVSGAGTSLRVVGRGVPLGVPDVTRLSAARPFGRYRWTVRRFPDMEIPENLSGRDARANSKSVVTAPRIVVFP